MKLKITRSTVDDTLYAVSDANRTRPMRTAELTRWLRHLGVGESEVASVLELGPAGSLTVDLADDLPGQIACAS